jgi:arylformamidase
MIQISYPLSRQSPLYRDSLPISIQSVKSIDNGDNSNSSSLSFSNHSGTHIDVPLHFCKNGKSVVDQLMSENLYYPTYCLDIPLTTQSPLRVETLTDQMAGISDAQALLIRTGMSKLRMTDKYNSDYPWVDPELPGFLREHFPDLRLFGIDVISVSNPAYREEGKICHRNFLCLEPAIMILEDLDLSADRLSAHPWLMRLYPWVLETLDAVPVVALLEEKALKNEG